MDPIKYFTFSMIIFILGIWGILLNRRNILIMLVSIELMMLLAVNLNFLFTIGGLTGIGTVLSFLVGSVGGPRWLVWLVRLAISSDLEGMDDFSNFMVPSDGERGWTSIFGSSNSESGNNSSVNQPARSSAEPVAHQQGEGGVPHLIPPELEDPNHLISAQKRMEDLGYRLEINSLGKSWAQNEWASILAAQIVVEEQIEAALLADGHSPASILEKWDQIRGIMFYPTGTHLTEKTYVGYAKFIDEGDSRDSVPYKRILRSIKNGSLMFP